MRAGAMMTGLGVLVVALGLILLVAEAHVSAAGILALLGAVAAAVGLGLLIAASGVGLLIAVPVAVVGAGSAATVVLLAVPRVVAALCAPVQAGPQRLLGSVAVVRGWHGDEGQVQAEGALWHARLAYTADQQEAPAPGEALIIQDIRGLTLTVRAAERWEVE